MTSPAIETDRVGLTWLATVRWTTLLAAVGAVVAGRSGVDTTASLTPALSVLAIAALSNIWFTWRVNVGRVAATMAGWLICLDVVVLSWLLLHFGGVLNPASVFYLVQIVVAALVLGRTWTWIVTALSVSGYALLFLAPPDELRSAQLMHPEIAVHMRGMWLAFALTALIIGVLVVRLAVAVERRDRALAQFHDRAARAAKIASLATVAAGAAHELGTPLATIAVASRELERGLIDGGAPEALRDDITLIRAELERCRVLLDRMAGRTSEPSGEAPQPTTVDEVIRDAIGQLSDAERARVACGDDARVVVQWPPHVVAQALVNVLRNGLQASNGSSAVHVKSAQTDRDRVRIEIADRGRGMDAEELARAGEPFYTTKPPGVGTGLGLFVTRSAIDQLGGTVTLSSRPGQGTTVTIVLPQNVATDATGTEAAR